MYEIDLDYLRYKSRCFVYANIGRIIEFMIDTGARFTCCDAYKVSRRLREEDMKDRETKVFGGYEKGHGIIHYKYRVAKFDIGNIHLGSQDIWITIDDNASDSILGMDILRQVTVLQLANSDKMMLFENEYELYNYVSGTLHKENVRL